MPSYRGPATVIDPDGEEHDVRATLTTSGSGWYGALAGEAPWLELQGETCSLRVGDRRGDFTIRNVDLVDVLAAVMIEAAGAPPF